MKKLIIIIIFILSFQIASAMYSGESMVIHSFPECLNLTITINASLQINEGEFSFLNFTKINQSYWVSNCSDNFDLTLTTEQNTINDYSFYILYYTPYGESAVVLNGGGRGNIRCNTQWQCTGWSKCSQAETQTRVCTDKNNCGTTTGKPVEIQKCNYVPIKTAATHEEEKPAEPETTSGEVKPVLAEEPPVTEEVVDNATEGLGGVTGRFFQNITGSNKWIGIGIILLILLFGWLFYFFVLKKK